MLRLCAIPIAAALAAAPAAVQAEPGFQTGEWDLQLAGSANNGPDFDGTAISAAIAAGYFFTDELSLRVKQSVTFEDFSGGGNLNGSTGLGLLYHFQVDDQLYPYVGANLGYAYGDAVNDSFFAGPEAGVKYFVNDSTYIFLGVEYQFFFDKGDSVSNAVSNGQFIYQLGVGFTF